jgi:hypothetical protein
MKTCKDCIHSHVCGITHTDSSESCDNFLYEDDARRTLRMIYADFTANSKRNRARAEKYSNFGEHGSAADLRRVSDIQASSASRVRFWCQKIGFDPSANG